LLPKQFLRKHAFSCLIKKEEVDMSIRKIFDPKKGVCRVFFTLPESLTDHVKKVAIVGDFNDWNPEKHSMKKNIKREV
jgi:hypothetical protein